MSEMDHQDGIIIVTTLFLLSVCAYMYTNIHVDMLTLANRINVPIYLRK